jgi:hypothetical protein
MANYKKMNITLPQEVRETFTAGIDELDRNAYIKALRERGWTLESIATVVGVSRERIRQICDVVPMSDAIRIATRGYPIPEPPKYEEKVPASAKYVEPTPETLQRLLELQPYAQQVRSHGKAFRKEAEEYTWLLNYAHVVEGVTLYRLAKRLGVTHGALRFRLARYGYKKSESGESKAYTPIIKENRIVFQQPE